jgi:hypothetical protein
VRVESVQLFTDPDEPRAAIATINYRLVATQVTDRVDVNLRLGA